MGSTSTYTGRYIFYDDKLFVVAWDSFLFRTGCSAAARQRVVRLSYQVCSESSSSSPALEKKHRVLLVNSRSRTGNPLKAVSVACTR